MAMASFCGVSPYQAMAGRESAPDDISGGDLSQFIRQECSRQAEQRRGMMRHFESVNVHALECLDWVSDDGMWDAIGAACGAGTINALASRIRDLAPKIDPSIVLDSPRRTLLVGLSLVDTYEETWRAVLGSPAGHERRLLEIHRLECEINATVRRLVSGSHLYFRGTSFDEVADMCSDTPFNHSIHYRFVSLTMAPQVAMWHAIHNDLRFSSRRIPIVMILDASYDYGSGRSAILTQYSMASQILKLEYQNENVGRMSRLDLANEVETCIDGRWQAEDCGALLGVSPVGELDDCTRQEIERLGIRVIKLDIENTCKAPNCPDCKRFGVLGVDA